MDSPLFSFYRLGIPYVTQSQCIFGKQIITGIVFHESEDIYSIILRMQLVLLNLLIYLFLYRMLSINANKKGNCFTLLPFKNNYLFQNTKFTDMWKKYFFFNIENALRIKSYTMICGI